MENIANMSGYFHSLERSLDCPKAVRRPFLDRTRQMAEDFIQGNPEVTSQDVTNFLGEPQELARGFLETLDPEVLERYHKRKKLLRRGFVALLVAALAFATVWGIRLYRSPKVLEVVETTTIYQEFTEET